MYINVNDTIVFVLYWPLNLSVFLLHNVGFNVRVISGLLFSFVCVEICGHRRRSLILILKMRRLRYDDTYSMLHANVKFH